MLVIWLRVVWLAGGLSGDLSWIPWVAGIAALGYALAAAVITQECRRGEPAAQKALIRVSRMTSLCTLMLLLALGFLARAHARAQAAHQGLVGRLSSPASALR
jgi:hypothetical protein